MALFHKKMQKTKDIARITEAMEPSSLDPAAASSEENLAEVKHYIGDVTHSLRMPIAVISGYAELLVKGLVTDEETKQLYLKKILEHAKYADERLSNLLQAAGIEFSGTIRRHPVNLVALVSKIAADLSPVLTASDIRIRHIMAEKNIIVNIDDFLFLKVFHNILDNAMKHMGRPGTITITVSRGEGDILMIFRDDGLGADTETVQSLLSGDRVFSESGGGFGLYHARNVIAAHGGRLEVKSIRCDGFGGYITLPAFPGDADPS
jgi:two-component system OmpR family sensor kinase